MNHTKERTKSIALISIMAALLEVVKLAFAALPNVELVTLLIITFTLVLGRKTMYAVLLFIGMECCIWGIQLWTVMYLFVWPILVLLVLFFRKQNNFFFCILSGIFGLCFGALCSIVYLFVGGIPMAFSWWVSGIIWDVVHGISNFILCMILLPRLRKLLMKISPLS